MMDIVCYIGTSIDGAKKITKHNELDNLESEGVLGKGVYFYADEQVLTPLRVPYLKELCNHNNYDVFRVVRAKISKDNIYDLDAPESTSKIKEIMESLKKIASTDPRYVQISKDKKKLEESSIKLLCKQLVDMGKVRHGFLKTIRHKSKTLDPKNIIYICVTDEACIDKKSFAICEY